MINENLFWLYEYEKCIRDKYSIDDYQNNARVYLDEYQEERNLFMENRFLRKN